MLNNVLIACVERLQQHQNAGFSLLKKRIVDPIKPIKMVFLHPPSLCA
jgi:hypothetical protein